MSSADTDEIFCHSDEIDKVFGNDLLLEIILTYVLCGQRNRISSKNLASVRLVQKRWLQTASSLAKKARDPLLSIVFQDDDDLLIYRECIEDAGSDPDLEETGKRLDLLTSTFNSENPSQIAVFPIGVGIMAVHFQLKNYYSLLSFLTKCGQHLRALTVEFPADGGSMPVNFPHFTLPNLKDLTFIFTNQSCEEATANLVFGDNRNGLVFLQSILNATQGLKYFEVSGTSKESLPMNLEYLILPETIISITLTNEFTTNIEHLLLRRNKLPHLLEAILEFGDSDVGNSNSSLSNFLEHFRHTLKCLTFNGDGGSVICFPEMESLEVLGLSYVLIEVNSSLPTLQKCMPKLKKVILDYDVVLWITELTKSGGFTSVEELDMFASKEDETELLNYKAMEQLGTGFPNLQRLRMTANVSEMTSLKYLFGQMKQLKALEIAFAGEIDEFTSKEIDSVLLGLPNNSKEPRLLNLSGLRKLHLTSQCKLMDGESSLLTEVIFQQGLLQMTNLQMLLLSGKFKPTAQMQEDWKKQGRFMDYRKGIPDDGDIIRTPYDVEKSII